MKPVKIAKSLLPVILLCFAVFGCSGGAQKSPDELIVGDWEYMSQTWCEFDEDNMCIIGGMAGEYKIDENNSITLSVYNSDEELKFEWAESADNADFEHWYVDENYLYINGMQYPRIEEDEAAAATNQSDADTSNESSSGSDSSADSSDSNSSASSQSDGE